MSLFSFSMMYFFNFFLVFWFLYKASGSEVIGTFEKKAASRTHSLPHMIDLAHIISEVKPGLRLAP